MTGNAPCKQTIGTTLVSNVVHMRASSQVVGRLVPVCGMGDSSWINDVASSHLLVRLTFDENSFLKSIILKKTLEGDSDSFVIESNRSMWPLNTEDNQISWLDGDPMWFTKCLP